MEKIIFVNNTIGQLPQYHMVTCFGCGANVHSLIAIIDSYADHANDQEFACGVCRECVYDFVPRLIGSALMAEALSIKTEMFNKTEGPPLYFKWSKDLQYESDQQKLSKIAQDGLEKINIKILEVLIERLAPASHFLQKYLDEKIPPIRELQLIKPQKKHISLTHNKKTKLAEAIYKYREANNLTQTQFAKYVGLKNNQIVSRLEKGTYDFLKVRTRMRLREKGFPI